MIHSNFIVVELKLSYWNLFFLLLNHFPDEAALIEVILHLLVERVCNELFKVVSWIALESEKIKQYNRVHIAAGSNEKEF